MFVPFVFTLDSSYDNYYLWIFYKFLGMAKKHNSPIIAQEGYFVDPEVFKQNGFFATSVEGGELFEYDIPTSDDMYKIQQYPILKKLEEDLIKEYGSQTAAWLYLLKERSEYFEEYIGNIIDDIVEKNSDTIEGIFTFCNIPSLSYVSEKRNIPIIHLEWGPLRNPVYRKTAYMNLKGENELSKRYEKFINEIQENSVCLLSRKEILSMFLDYKFIDNINLLDCSPEYEMGIACTYSLDVLSLASSGFLNNLEHITMAKRYYNEKVLAIRLHPGDPAKGNPSSHLVDNSPTAMHFINRCKRISVISSNVAFEAMLWGRTAYVLGNSPYAFKAQRELSIIDESIVDLEFINYVVFGYLIPYELMLDVDYLRWRLTNPTETEIYNYNLNYYLSCRGIEPSILDEKGIERLRKMLLVQGFDLSGKCIQNDENAIVYSSNTNNEFSSSIELNKKIQYMKNKINILNMKHEELETIYQNQLAETSKLLEAYQKLYEEYSQKCNEYEKIEKERTNLYIEHDSFVKEHTNKCENLIDESAKLVEMYSRNLDELKNIKQQCDALRSQYNSISNSTAWKITAPIRHFLDKIKGK
jgi:Capsule polysaccharide biosynthesis protein.